MIRIDALWLATTPIDMRMGTERLLARVVQVFGAAQAHHGYPCSNPKNQSAKSEGPNDSSVFELGTSRTDSA